MTVFHLEGRNYVGVTSCPVLKIACKHIRLSPNFNYFKELVLVLVSQDLVEVLWTYINKITESALAQDMHKPQKLTWILAVVLGSRKDFTVFHRSLNPEPALMINIRLRVYSGENQWASRKQRPIIFWGAILNHLRIVITVNLLKLLNEFPCTLIEIF